MANDPDRKPFSGLRNPALYTSLVILLAALYSGWTLYSRRQMARELEERAKAEKLAMDQKIVDSLGGSSFDILNFYASPPLIKHGETAQLCYGVSNAKSVHLEPQENKVWPSFMRCVDVAPKKDTTYTLTAEDGNGNTKTATVVVKVR
jgi:type II secretory pathway pseudopilin PulG